MLNSFSNIYNASCQPSCNISPVALTSLGAFLLFDTLRKLLHIPHSKTTGILSCS